jgi:hypothetical protein
VGRGTGFKMSPERFERRGTVAEVFFHCPNRGEW